MPAPNTTPVEEPLVDDDAESEVETPTEEEEPKPETPQTGDSFDNLSPREKALVERARAQEKAKLYKTLADLKEKNRLTEERLVEASQPKSKKRKADEEEDDVRNEVANLRKELAERDRRAELREYRSDRLEQERNTGTRLIESLVVGDTEEEIDASIAIAKAEFSYIAAEVEQDMRRKGSRTSVTVQNNTRPNGAVPTVSAAPVAHDEDTVSLNDIAEMTSMESIRDGSYAANRKKLLAAVRSGRVRA